MTGDSLRLALASNKAQITAALVDAEAELEACRRACSELEDLVALGRRLVGTSTHGSPASMTLHEAMSTILADFPSGLSAADLARRVNDRGLYRRRDGTPVEPVLIHARATQYAQRFDRREKRIVVRVDPA